MKSQNTHRIAIIPIFLLSLLVTIHAQDKRSEKHSQKALKRLNNVGVFFEEWQHLGAISVDSVNVLEETNQLEIFCSNELSYMPVREREVEELNQSIYKALKRKYKSYQLSIYTGGYLFTELVPNAFRENLAIDNERFISETNSSSAFVQNIHQKEYNSGLSHKHIALWHSHGYYYENTLDRWEWQRARLFSTVEDILPMSFVIPYLTPMLENAGAYVMMPRERDFQINEVVVDNDRMSSLSEFILNEKVEVIKEKGFAIKDTLFPGDNPFELGSSLRVNSDNLDKIASYVPDIPEDGEYAVYVSYYHSAESSTKVKYNVNHSGGASTYLVDQSRGGGIWVYLGRFHFKQGKDDSIGSVEVSGQGTISLDAVRFGGGMGNVARRNTSESIWKLSGKPRYMEAARYYMQYAGIPDSLVFSLNDEQKDYKDDYMSRGEWVNYLIGSPYGPQANKNVGLNIPIDLAFAFHTDAGTTINDSVIGTLGIYSSLRDEGVFPNGRSKLSSRDLTDIIQSQLVDDVSKLYDVKWTRRAMWDKQYSEAWRPNVPTMLLELLSHQNLADMQLALDPNFRFNVSRSIYKAILKYLAYQERREYIVQPLPVDHLAIQPKGEQFELSWQAVADPLEETAVPTKYKVYKRVGNSGFDNGTVIESNSLEVKAPAEGEIHSYKVTAINEGGESMPSEILSHGTGQSKEMVLVVNAFDRVSAPAFIDENNFAGIAWWKDEGVADRFDYSYVGRQYDYNRQSPWLDDDSPGWGASYGNEEGNMAPGNSFDNPYIHGEAIINAGYSFISMSDEVFINAETSLEAYAAIDVILGEEKANIPNHQGKDYRIFTTSFITKLQDLKSNQIPILLSGAYVASDMLDLNDTIAIEFAEQELGFKWRTNYATKTGGVNSTDEGKAFFQTELEFNTAYHPSIYKVEAPDAIEPSGKAITAYRYSENNASAIVYNMESKILIMGFPFETIIDRDQRNRFMKEILKAFTEERKDGNE